MKLEQTFGDHEDQPSWSKQQHVELVTQGCAVRVWASPGVETQWHLKMTPASSLSTHGCILSGSMNLCLIDLAVPPPLTLSSLLQTSLPFSGSQYFSRLMLPVKMEMKNIEYLTLFCVLCHFLYSSFYCWGTCRSPSPRDHIVVAYTEKQLKEIELNKPRQSLYKVPDLRTRQAANVPRQQVRLSDVGFCPLWT